MAACEDCAHIRIAYNSCRNRHCPKCQAAAKDWLAARQAELLPVPYYHVVFTPPARVADIAYQNKAAVYGILFKGEPPNAIGTREGANAETLITIAADPKHLGARIGLTAVLHSWGSALTHHPHLHRIVPGGGISLARGAEGASPTGIEMTARWLGNTVAVTEKSYAFLGRDDLHQAIRQGTETGTGHADRERKGRLSG